MTEFSRLTRGLRTGIDTDMAFGAVVPPMHLTTTYSFTGFDQPRDYDYSRCGNPTRDLLAEALSTLEGGAGGVVTATGLAAITLVVQALTRPGDTVVVPHDAYGGTWRLFDRLAGKGVLNVETVDFADSDRLDAALAGRPALVWIETPSNPLLRLTDIAAVSAKAQEVGALVAVDNTFCTPLLQRPIELGADVVVHSTTKYLNGHSDVVGGAAIAATPELHEQLADWCNVLGLPGSPFDSYLSLRGVRTLQTRMRAHQENAAVIADRLSDDEAVARVHFPGLAEHPDHELAIRQQDGFGAMVSFSLVAGEAGVRRFVGGLRCFTLAESLGGTESLVAHPATMTHAAMTPEARARAGIDDGLIRLSVGIEPVEDLLTDLTDALNRAAA